MLEGPNESKNLTFTAVTRIRNNLVFISKSIFIDINYFLYFSEIIMIYRLLPSLIWKGPDIIKINKI